MMSSMKDSSCPFCNHEAQSKDYLLEETANFRIIADLHPLTEGHILVIPKEHIACVGDFTEELFQEFALLYEKVKNFIKKEYGNVSTFEHGKIGQLVFHSHMHVLPFSGLPTSIIPEGESHIDSTKGIDALNQTYKSDGQYLFFSIGDGNFLVDTNLGYPRFFRDRFAGALGNANRANWKEMHEDAELMALAHLENLRVMEKWKQR
ncbi:MAG: hypothetical protein JWM20_584 [Patescibacteria group bacterium]|nr:hypothetical protein [Patescibacteria group bacterium]